MKLLKKGWIEQLDCSGIEWLVNRNRNGDKTVKVLIESDTDEIKCYLVVEKTEYKARKKTHERA